MLKYVKTKRYLSKHSMEKYFFKKTNKSLKGKQKVRLKVKIEIQSKEGRVMISFGLSI